MIDVGGGVIDSDFRGNVGVIIFNHGPHPFYVEKQHRIAQLIFEKIDTPILLESPILMESPYDTASGDRGNKGYGSTGI
jgi:dUTP pyrophosphatase